MSNNDGKKGLYFQDSYIFDNLVIYFSFQRLIALSGRFFSPFVGFGVAKGDVGRILFFHYSIYGDGFIITA